jgi:hypothetical protein
MRAFVYTEDEALHTLYVLADTLTRARACTHTTLLRTRMHVRKMRARACTDNVALCVLGEMLARARAYILNTLLLTRIHAHNLPARIC